MGIEFAHEILKTKIVEGEDGKKYSLSANTSIEQCQLLQKIIFENKPLVAIEIGLAHGISSMFISDALLKCGGKKHIILDPYQDDLYWNNIGLMNLKRAGLSAIVEFHKEASQSFLPELSKKGIEINFAYIDSTKVFDQLLVDVHFLLLSMPIGGIIAMDDCDFPSIRKLCRLLVKFDFIEIYCTQGKDNFGWKQTMAKSIVAFFLKIIPFKSRLFPSLSFETDESLGLDYHFIAFRKIANDQRNWNWNKMF